MPNLAIDRRGLLAGAGLMLLAGPAWPQVVAKKRLGIIGSGHIGGALGTVLAKAGYPVMFASRKPEELASLVAEAGPLAKAGTPAEAVAFGEAVIIAVPFPVLPQLGRDMAAALQGKPVLVASNAVAPRDGDVADEAKRDGVGATTLKYLPGQHVVRAFWAVNYKAVLAEPERGGERLGMPIAGDDPVALPVALELTQAMNFDPVLLPMSRAGDAGPGSPIGVTTMTAAEYKQRLGLKS
jgi:predicted dinucleotide-binding enzyme